MLKLSQMVLNTFNTKTNVLRYNKLLKSSTAKVRSIPSEDSDVEPPKSGRRSSMVAAAFASLKPDINIRTPITDEKINKAESIEELFSISEGSGVSRKHALNVVSTLAQWSSSGKVKISDFESDTRFIQMCRVLSKSAKVNINIKSRSKDLSTVLNVTAEDEAARLIAGLNLTQMVKVINTLAMRKRRSIVLLRTLAYNIAASSEHLNIKQCADVLYSICVLNFIDENLLEKITAEISNEIKHDIQKSSVVGSIITSFGLLRYKRPEILDILSDWILQNQKICRSQDLFSLFITLAVLNYEPSNAEQLFNALLPQLTESEAAKTTLWLNFVWSLVILNRVPLQHVLRVLSQEFVKQIEVTVTENASSHLKLLNINGAAKYLLKDYEGDFITSTSSIQNASVTRTKEKSETTECVVSSLKNLIQGEQHLRVNVRTDFGYCIDAECLLDKKCKSLKFTEENRRRSDVTKVAIIVYDYHDMCIGKIEPSGVHALARRILEAQNYKVLAVPYTDFKPMDKLVRRVQFLEGGLKEIVK